MPRAKEAQPPLLLTRFRFVLNNDKSKDQAKDAPARRLLEESPAQFFAQMERMEAEWQKELIRRGLLPGAGEKGPEKPAEPQCEELEAVIARLEREWGAPAAGGKPTRRGGASTAKIGSAGAAGGPGVT